MSEGLKLPGSDPDYQDHLPAQAGQRRGGTQGDGGGCQIFSDRRGPVVRRTGGGTGYVQRKCGKLYKYLFTIRVKRSIIST